MSYLNASYGILDKKTAAQPGSPYILTCYTEVKGGKLMLFFWSYLPSVGESL